MPNSLVRKTSDWNRGLAISTTPPRWICGNFGSPFHLYWPIRNTPMQRGSPSAIWQPIQIFHEYQRSFLLRIQALILFPMCRISIPPRRSPNASIWGAPEIVRSTRQLNKTRAPGKWLLLPMNPCFFLLLLFRYVSGNLVKSAIFQTYSIVIFRLGK